MKFLIIGSVATSHWASLQGKSFREPHDIDIMSNGIPFVPSPTPSKLLIENSWFDEASEYMVEQNKDPVFLDLDFMYTLKLSHACYPIKIDKTLSDMRFLKILGGGIDYDLLKMLRSHWLKIHGKHTGVSLDVNTSDFFSDAVNRKYDHDMVHELCAHPQRPAYEQFLSKSDSPIFDKKLWEAGDFREKIRSAMEEIVVTAIERHLVTKTDKLKQSDKLNAIQAAYKQLVTTMTKGDFNVFMLDNMTHIMQSRLLMMEMIDNVLEKLKDVK